MARLWMVRGHSGGTSQRRSGILAGMTAIVAFGYLYLNFEPAPAGTHSKTKKNRAVQLASAIEAMPLPVVRPTAPSQAPQNGAAPKPAAVVAKPTSPQAETSEADRIALLMNLALLEQGRRRLLEIPDYTCTFFKQERIGSELSDGQEIELKMRHKPFSIYMKWLSGDKGRELLYVDGQQDNKMIVHPGGWKARLLPAIKVDPDGSLALREARHPVTMVGLVKLCEEIIGHRKQELEHRHPVRCQIVEHQVMNERPCYCFISLYIDRKTSEEYRKSIQYIDKEWLLPVCVKNYGWPEAKQTFTDQNALDEATLIEHYAYSDLQVNQQLASEDFDRANKSYSFRR